MSDTTDIIIYLTDTPDTPPQFETTSIHASIYENLPTLTYITTVIAVDPDTGQAGEFYFRINSTFLDGNLFVINSTTGKIWCFLFTVRSYCCITSLIRISGYYEQLLLQNLSPYNDISIGTTSVNANSQ